MTEKKLAKFYAYFLANEINAADRDVTDIIEQGQITRESP